MRGRVGGAVFSEADAVREVWEPVLGQGARGEAGAGTGFGGKGGSVWS